MQTAGVIVSPTNQESSSVLLRRSNTLQKRCNYLITKYSATLSISRIFQLTLPLLSKLLPWVIKFSRHSVRDAGGSYIYMNPLRLRRLVVVVVVVVVVE